ncbi:MAG: copper amine oxidase N-terminal domain-containing protein, partial [Firmicutes bacterium]|nr:copper amine oxidase N-terminal domain-containing protein [Bacillota bacterium]
NGLIEIVGTGIAKITAVSLEDENHTAAEAAFTLIVSKDEYSGDLPKITSSDVSISKNSISVKNPAAGFEYACSDSDEAPENGWRANGKFSGLKENSVYFLFMRAAESKTTEASPPSAAFEFITSKAVLRDEPMDEQSENDTQSENPDNAPGEPSEEKQDKTDPAPVKRENASEKSPRSLNIVPIPVSNAADSIYTDIFIDAGTAILLPITSSDMEMLLHEKNGSPNITVDISSLGSVTGIIIHGDDLGKIADTIASNDEKQGFLEIVFSDHSIKFDAAALTTLSESAKLSGSNNIEISISNTHPENLTPDQRSLTENIPFLGAFTAVVSANDEAISDFGGGLAEITVPSETAEEQDPNFFKIWYIDDFGKATRLKTYFENEKITASVGHCSDFIVVYDDPKEKIVLTIGKNDALVFGESVSSDTSPLIRNDCTALPLRFVVEALGGSIVWEADARTATLSLGETEIKIEADSDIALVNGLPMETRLPAFIENDRLYLPLRFVAENLGCRVLWMEELKEVTIYR